ncbi:hypothetical protein JCM11641_001775 [Rhodosporidiobolus odoratus]
MKAVLALAALSALPAAFAGATVDPNNLPHTSESGQYGYNDCTKYGDSSTANCQTLRVESLDDFCLYAPPQKATIGDSERYEVAYCTRSGHGTRLFPKGTITGAHYLKTPDYIQITGTLDGTKINIPKGDEGGELDPHGADGNGNPIGAVVLSSALTGSLTQVKEWTQFISDNEFCLRICNNGPNAYRWCNHIYDVMGCYWNEPGNYNKGSFDTCAADDVAYPMGEYPVVKNGKTSISTWHQGVNPTPSAQAPAKSSQCKSQATITAASYTTSRVTTTTRPTSTKAPSATCTATSQCNNAVPANAHR